MGRKKKKKNTNKKKTKTINYPTNSESSFYNLLSAYTQEERVVEKNRQIKYTKLF